MARDTLTWAMVWAVALAGCASAGEPSGSSGTDGSSGATGETTDPTIDSATTDPTFDPATTEPDPSESGDATTTTEGETTIATGGGTGEGTGTTGGCEPGTLDCACAADADPVCEEGLECVDDVCVMPLCGVQEDEPNDVPDEAVDLGSFDDTDDPQNFTSQLAGTDDVDWHTYHCVDTLFGDLDPALVIEQGGDMRVCLFLDCDIGGNPLFSCPEGTVSEQAPFDFLPGCCVTDGSSFDLGSYNCPDSSDDSVSAWIRVDQAARNVCVPYAITYQC